MKGIPLRRFLAALIVPASQLLMAPAVAAGLDFKGIPMGASVETVKKAAKVNCSKPSSGVVDLVCSYANGADNTFAGLYASGTVFHFIGGQLDSVQLGLQLRDRQAAGDAIKAKVGTPGACGVNGPVNTCRWNVGPDLIDMHWTSDGVLVKYLAGATALERDRRAEMARSKALGARTRDL